MYRNGFGVEILTDRGMSAPFIRGEQYVPLREGAEYKIRLTNNRNVRADATIEVDGKEIGRWRVPANESITIERPAGIDQRLTFVSEQSRMGMRAGVIPGRFENGVIQITFYPEREYVLESRQVLSAPMTRASTSGSPMALGVTSSRYESGATILGDRSYQQFGRTSAITDVDWNNITTFTFRLVVEGRSFSPRAISRVPEWQLSGQSRIPPRIDSSRYQSELMR